MAGGWGKSGNQGKLLLVTAQVARPVTGREEMLVIRGPLLKAESFLISGPAQIVFFTRRARFKGVLLKKQVFVFVFVFFPY